MSSYWPSSSEALAAWVQAIGSIVAILAGFVAVAFQHWLAARHSQSMAGEEAFGIALLLERDVLELQKRILLAIANREVQSFSVPTAILDTAPKLHILGDAGKELLRLISLVRQNRDILEITAKDDGFGGRIYVESENYRKRLTSMMEAVESILEKFHHIFKK